ncbi:MAG: 2-hydroxymuconate tautomerase [Pontibacterium sp.]
MPFAQIHMIEGRSEEQLETVIQKVTDALAEASGAPKEAIRVVISEVPASHWGKAGVTAKSLGR